MTPKRDIAFGESERSVAAAGPDGFTDIHCHCLPALDDGPTDMAGALALCEEMVRDGIRQVVATPHQLGRFDDRNGAGVVCRAVTELNGALDDAGIALTVLPGADVRLDERIPQLLESDAVLTVADAGHYLLLELPHEVFIDPRSLLSRLGEMGVTAVITHPERHGFLASNPAYVGHWLEYAPCLQITAGSFLGYFGRQSAEAAKVFLQMDLAVVVATDAHGTPDRAPCMTAAYQWLTMRFGQAVADTVCIQNPRRAVAGEPLAVMDERLLREAR